MTDHVSARMAAVTGAPPRLDPLGPEELGEREMAIITRVRDITGFPQDMPVHPFYATLARQPDMFDAYMQFGLEAIAAAALGRRERELLILRTGWLCGAPYQFGEHVKTARAIGMTGEEIERIKRGSAAAGWGDADRALLAAAEELRADAMVSDATWSALAAHFGPRELIEVLMVVGHYHVTAFVQNTLRFRLNDDNRGLAAG
jgi:alkylhydroperoxidase family enzyme